MFKNLKFKGRLFIMDEIIGNQQIIISYRNKNINLKEVKWFELGAIIAVASNEQLWREIEYLYLIMSMIVLTLTATALFMTSHYIKLILHQLET